MTHSASSPQPSSSPGESPRRFIMLISALIGALVLGAVIAQQQGNPVSIGTKAAFAHPQPPPGHDHTPPTTRPPICSPPNQCHPPPTTARPTPTTTRPPICSPPNQCYPPPTTARPTPTTTRRPPPTTTRRPVTTTTRRPVTTTTRRPVTTTTRRPVTTTTRRPVTTTTRRPVTTTTRRPVTTTTVPAQPDCAPHCENIDQGVEEGWYDPVLEPYDDTPTRVLEDTLEAFGEDLPGFNTNDALAVLNDHEGQTVDRETMVELLAGGLDIPFDPDDLQATVDQLNEMGIAFGYTGPEDFGLPDHMNNGQMASFLNRIGDHLDPGNNNGGNNNGGNYNPGDPNDEMCTTGLVLSAGEQALFVSQLEWRTLVDIRAQGEPGVVWPPHPDVPGGSEFLVVSESPVWPVVDPLALWYVASDDGCLWEAISVQTRVTQLLPWRTSHRSIIENAATARPEAGFNTYLSRWDNLTAAQQAQAQQYHRNRDVSASCRIETAMVAADAADRCRWELPSPGVWFWQARACFEGLTEDTSFQECATLASGVEWFLGIIDYTSGITLHDPGASAGASSRHPAPTD